MSVTLPTISSQPCEGILALICKGHLIDGGCLISLSLVPRSPGSGQREYQFVQFILSLINMVQSPSYVLYATYVHVAHVEYDMDFTLGCMCIVICLLVLLVYKMMRPC